MTYDPVYTILCLKSLEKSDTHFGSPTAGCRSSLTTARASRASCSTHTHTYPTTAHRMRTHPDGTDVWASGGMFGRVRVRLIQNFRKISACEGVAFTHKRSVKAAISPLALASWLSPLQDGAAAMPSCMVVDDDEFSGMILAQMFEQAG